MRDRLRILGKSDAEIDALAAGGHDRRAVPSRAPIAGVVVDRQVGPGQYIQAGGGTPLFTIAERRTVWLVANVRGERCAATAPRPGARGARAGLPERVFSARLT